MTRYLLLTLGATLTVTQLACDAQQHYAALPGASELSATTLDSAGAPVRRVWARAQDYASPSPDGRFITFVDWSTGDVAMHDVVTGEDRRLTDKGTWTDNGSWAEEPLFSPNGRSVVYSYGNVLGPEQGFQYELRVVDVEDTTQRVLHALTPGDQWLAATDWSPSQGILVEINLGEARGFATELAVVDPKSGALRVIRTYAKDEAHPHDAAFSPDGRFIVYRQGKAVRVMTADGTHDESLDVEARWVLGWSRDGGGVLIHGSGQGTTGIWAVPVADGRRAGAPALVRGGMGAFLPGGLVGESYYYVVPVDAPRIYTVSVDIPTGRVLSPPVAITTAVDGAAREPAWSPDGRTLAYPLLDVAERHTRLMLRAADGDEVRELTTIPQTQIRGFMWAPDGQSLLVHTGTREGPALFRVDIRSGEVKLAYAHPGEAVAIVPDGRIVFVRHSTGGDTPPGLFIADLGTGKERRIAELAAPTQALGVSPDGRQVALVLARDDAGATRAVVLPIDGGAMREIAREHHPMHYEHNAMGPVIWTPDGARVLLMRGSWEGGNHEIVAVPVAGGAPTSVVASQRQRGHALHPDGRRMAYVGGDTRMEMWVLDDLKLAGR